MGFLERTQVSENMENVKESRTKRVLLTILTALMLAMSAGVVAADGTDPLDPSDGGADWDGDGLTNAEEQNEGTNFNNPDTCSVL